MAQPRKAPARSTPTKSPPAKSSRARARPAPAGLFADEIPLLEWISASIGLVLVLIAVGFTGWEAFSGDHSPPSIEVRLLEVRQTPYGFVAQVEAENHGGSPAGQVVVVGALTGVGGQEAAQATFDYVPDKSTVTGGLMFEQDPRRGRLSLRAQGYVDLP